MSGFYALERMIAEELCKSGEKLHKCSFRSPWYSCLGDYFITDAQNHIVATHADLDQLATSLDVITPVGKTYPLHFA